MVVVIIIDDCLQISVALYLLTLSLVVKVQGYLWKKALNKKTCKGIQVVSYFS